MKDRIKNAWPLLVFLLVASVLVVLVLNDMVKHPEQYPDDPDANCVVELSPREYVLNGC